MPEIAEHPQIHEFANQHAEALAINANLQRGLETATQYGFNLEASLQKDYPDSSPEELVIFKDQVLQTATGIAEQVGLKDEFYDKPSNVVLLVAIADSWLKTEDEVANTEHHNPTITKEREMLADVLFILANENSTFMTEYSKTNTKESERYVPNGEESENSERRAFLESISDDELAQKVTNILMADGEGSFLQKQREALGIKPGEELPFTVRVLNMGDMYDLKSAGHISQVEWPEYRKGATGLEQYNYRLKSKIASDRYDAAKAIAQPFVDAEKEYEERFSAEHGPIAPAFVNHRSDGSVELTIRAAEAHLIINTSNGKPVRMSEDDIERQLAIIRHEYGHTQKYLFEGEHLQLGLMLEERKAELISGDKQGYQDVKYLFSDLSTAMDADVMDTFSQSLKEPDSIGSFISRVSNDIGLRNTLLLMTAKPLPYDKDPTYSKQFADLGCLVKEGDASTLDVIIRESLEKMGDQAATARAEKWAQRLKDNGGDLDFIRNDFMTFRANHGVRHMNQIFVKAIDKVRAT